jgi:release factor glutamine methyltransferase
MRMTDLAERRDHETSVYQPAEDSHLLTRVALDHVETTDRVLEVGCGSGAVAERIAETGASVVASDLNPHACRATVERSLPTVRADLVAPYRANVFDVVLFNPPYLPDAPAVDREDWMRVALSGGPDGRAVIESFLDDVGRVLREDGLVLLLISSLTGEEAIVTRATANGFTVSVLSEESYPYEKLSILGLEMH